MRTKMTVGRMAVKTTTLPVRGKSVEQLQAESLKRYNAKQANKKLEAEKLNAFQAKKQSEYITKKKLEAQQKSGTYKTNAKGQIVLADGRVIDYKGGVAPKKFKNANVQVKPGTSFAPKSKK